jgi:hypothetical protein
VLAALIGASLNLTIRAAEVPAANGPSAPAPDTRVQGVQVLTRGPVHEAFAGMVTYNPEPGIVVVKAPPEMIGVLLIMCGRPAAMFSWTATGITR